MSMNDTNIFRKNFIWNLIGTTLNSFNSMFFMIVITRINGVSDAGIFTLLFSVANLLYNIGIYSGRTFQVTDRSGKYTDTEYAIHRVITVSAMFIIGALYCVFKNYDTYRFVLTMLLTFMKCIEAGVDVLHGILQKKDLLYQSGISYTIRAALSLIALIAVDMWSHNLVLSFIIIDAIWLTVTLFYDFPNTLKYLDHRYEWNKVLSLFQNGFYAFAFAFLNIYLANATKYAMDGLTTSAEQAMYGIILMPATLINLCAIYLLQPYINRMGVLYSENKIQEFVKSCRLIVIGICAIGMAALLGATFLGVPVLNVIYNVELSPYLRGLQLIIAGATFTAISTVLSTALTTFRNTKVQFYIYLIASIFIYFTAPVLIRQMGTLGASIAYLLATAVQLVLYFAAYQGDLSRWKKGWIREVSE